MDRLVPSISPFIIRSELLRGKKTTATCRKLSLWCGDTIITIDIDQGRVNVFACAVDDNSIFRQGYVCPDGNDPALADKKSCIRQCSLPVFNNGSIGKGE